MPVKLSVVVITLNEERLIGKCLESVKDLADEILVVDSFSTDRTREICESYGARFVEHEFHGHIEQTNYALDLARYNHILALDADESLTPAAQKSVLAIKDNFDHDAYQFNRLNNFCGTWMRHGAWYPDRKIRLWNRSKGRWDGENPHYLVRLKPGSTVRQVDGDILHFTTESISAYLKQVNYFSDIAAQNMIADDRTFRLSQLLVRPPFRFFRDYLLKRGFLDGLPGLILAAINAYAAFLKYAKFYLLQKQDEAPPQSDCPQ